MTILMFEQDVEKFSLKYVIGKGKSFKSIIRNVFRRWFFAIKHFSNMTAPDKVAYIYTVYVYVYLHVNFWYIWQKIKIQSSD